ncbi:hypothetical protein [Paucibacter sp. KCTC 42545]|uniref:hypothetical protein n=1 Tax=Paucibacter sp. KCTC 42545 TaxID=1768242 RepID=UPI001E596769|nr:hypothetical protein [Paucibacter sp. KCTC 42545]
MNTEPRNRVESDDATFAVDLPPPTSRLARWAMAIAWPAFVMAGVTEGLVFSVVDPSDLTWFGGERMELSRQAVYTLSFLIFWSVISLASSISLMLATLPETPDAPQAIHPRRWPQ